MSIRSACVQQKSKQQKFISGKSIPHRYKISFTDYELIVTFSIPCSIYILIYFYVFAILLVLNWTFSRNFLVLFRKSSILIYFFFSSPFVRTWIISLILVPLSWCKFTKHVFLVTAQIASRTKAQIILKGVRCSALVL